MNKKDICIIIPIYKENLNEFEILSVNQCIKILSDYTICFVAPEGLDLTFYKTKFAEIKQFVFFDKKFFSDIAGYNRLMLSVGFYKKFGRYKYMLVYQTDCYVFKDELLDWVNKGYDYIGGIWFDDYIGDPCSGAQLWQAGNGGLSLRNIKSISRMLSSTKPIKKWRELYVETLRLRNKGRKSFLKGIFLLPFYIFGYENNINYNSKTWQFNEDAFIVETSFKLQSFKIPNVEEVISFSWDRHPEFLFELLGNLPFACHAWYRDDFPYEQNKKFWIKIH